MAGPTFAEALITKNGQFDPAADRKLPPMSLLAVGSMPTTTALGGTNGQDCGFIHGDEWQEIIGKRTEHVALNDKVTIDEDEQRTIGQNQTITVNGFRHIAVWGETDDRRGGVHHQTNFMPRTENYYHVLTENHTEPNKIHQPTSFFDTVHSYFKWTTVNISLGLVLDVGIKNLSASAGTFDIGYKVISISNNVFAMKQESFGWKDMIAGIDTGGAKLETLGAKAKFAATHLKAIGANINAGIAANADSPLA